MKIAYVEISALVLLYILPTFLQYIFTTCVYAGHLEVVMAERLGPTFRNLKAATLQMEKCL
jgi:hypothetical protein